MKSVPEVLGRVLQQPTPAALLDLQGAILGSGQTGARAERVLEIAGQFHAYLCELESKITARDYSELASRLDMGAVGMVAVENLIAAKDEKLVQRLLAGGLGEGLMVAASRQYVKAWQVETGLVHRNAAWYLSRALWQVSCDMHLDLPDDRRWQMIQSLLAPAHREGVAASDKALLLGRIFQLLLLAHLVDFAPRSGGTL